MSMFSVFCLSYEDLSWLIDSVDKRGDRSSFSSSEELNSWTVSELLDAERRLRLLALNKTSPLSDVTAAGVHEKPSSAGGHLDGSGYNQSPGSCQLMFCWLVQLDPNCVCLCPQRMNPSTISDPPNVPLALPSGHRVLKTRLNPKERVLVHLLIVLIVVKTRRINNCETL